MHHAPPAPAGYHAAMRRRYLPLAIFVLPYLIGFTALAYRRGSTEFLFYAGMMVFFIALALWMDRKVCFRIGTLWLLAVWGFLHMAGGTVPIPESLADGEIPVLYALRPHASMPRYDQFIHVYGFFAAALAAFDALEDAFRSRTNGAPLRVSFGIASAVALISIGLGAINELVEFVATLIMEETGVGGYVNTGWDLVSNAIGASFGAAYVWLRARRDPVVERA